MLLYLIRHAHAVDETEDPLRPLSDFGREQVDRLLPRLRSSQTFRPQIFWHSPLMRAKETAQLIAEGLGLPAPVHEVAGLLPEDDPRITAARLSGVAHSIALVGHEPHLGLLATMLVAGDLAATPILFEKGEVVTLSGDPRSKAPWELLARLLPPSAEDRV